MHRVYIYWIVDAIVNNLDEIFPLYELFDKLELKFGLELQEND